MGWRIFLLLVIAAFMCLAIVGFVHAQQSELNLSEGDDIWVDCPTQISVSFDDQGATVNCALSADTQPGGSPAGEVSGSASTP